MIPTPTYEIGSTVYPKLFPLSENALIITGYLIRAGGLLIYMATNADGEEGERYEFELTDEKGYNET